MRILYSSQLTCSCIHPSMDTVFRTLSGMHMWHLSEGEGHDEVNLTHSPFYTPQIFTHFLHYPSHLGISLEYTLISLAWMASWSRNVWVLSASLIQPKTHKHFIFLLTAKGLCCISLFLTCLDNFFYSLTWKPVNVNIFYECINTLAHSGWLIML